MKSKNSAIIKLLKKTYLFRAVKGFPSLIHISIFPKKKENLCALFFSILGRPSNSMLIRRPYSHYGCGAWRCTLAIPFAVSVTARIHFNTLQRTRNPLPLPLSANESLEFKNLPLLLHIVNARTFMYLMPLNCENSASIQKTFSCIVF